MPSETLKVATFNVNSLRARLRIVLDWLVREGPDVLCLQETKLEDGKFPVKEIESVHYHAVFRGEKAYNGVAVLSKSPAEDVRIGFDEEESGGERIITAVIRKIPIINTYVPQGRAPHSEQFLWKLEWFLTLHEYFEQNFRPGDPLLWVGDFNVAPEPEDVYDPEMLAGQVGFHPDEREALERLRQWGFVDVFRLHRPELRQFTFWDYRMRGSVARNRGWRIDHIWATRPMAEKSTSAWIDMEPRLAKRPSDHTVLVAEFEVP
jgi:exodeoxyribonuclease-3